MQNGHVAKSINVRWPNLLLYRSYELISILGRNNKKTSNIFPNKNNGVRSKRMNDVQITRMEMEKDMEGDSLLSEFFKLS